MIKHSTASVFLICEPPDYRIVLVRHKSFRKWMLPGGHVESWENPFQAALREVREETGLKPRFVTFVPNNARFGTYNIVPNPELIIEEEVPATKSDPKHVHIDFLYVAVTENPLLQAGFGESLELHCFLADELSEIDMFQQTRDLARAIISNLKEGLPFRSITERSVLEQRI